VELAWEWDIWVVAPLAISAALYIRGTWLIWRRAGIGRGVQVWQASAFLAGWLVLFVALISPLHEFGEHLFVAHMIEHELLMVVAAPLFVVAQPLALFMRALPSGWRHALVGAAHTHVIKGAWSWLMRPVVATLLHGVAIWVWHVPAFLDATLQSEGVHRLQHISFFGTALIFWWAMIRRSRRAYGESALHIFVTLVHTGVLGALLTLAPRVLYPQQTADAPLFGLTSLEDQQLAGLFMWVPGGAVYLLAGLWFAGLWLGSSQHSRGLVTSDVK
jgi:putative membrane protein